MIIFGTRGVTYSKAVGQFFCPTCNSRLPYKHKRVRRFFSLYFIPVIPMDLVGEYVECQHCRGTYQLAVLEYDPEVIGARIEAEFRRAVKRVMVLMMLADGVVDDDEVRTIQKVFAQVASVELSDDAIREEIELAQTDGQSIEAFLGELAGHLNDEGREVVLKGAFLVAAADGEFQDEERALLDEISKALGMTSAHAQGVIQSMMHQGEHAEA